jgi:hypothetical protein
VLQFFDTLTDDSGNALLGATVLVTNFVGGGPAAIFQSNGTSSPVANSTVSSDITGQVSFYAPDGAYTLVYSYQGTIYKTRSPVQILDPAGFIRVTDSGTANSYVLNSSILPAQLYVGFKAEFIAASANTGASTINVNGTGPQPFTLPPTTPLLPGSIQAGGIYRIEWDGTQWQLLSSISPAAYSYTRQSLGQLFYPQTAQELAASVTPTNYFYPSGNVLRYGADPTGIADSTNAFQQALNSVSYIVNPTTVAQCLAQGGDVYVPRGIYLITWTLYLNSNVHLVGEDCGPLEQSPLQITGTIGGAMIVYSNPTQQSICIDATGFWLTAQTAYNGTASAAASSTITITAGLTIAVNSGTMISIIGGTGSGQIRPVSAYNASTGVLSVGWPWTTNPDNTSAWAISGHAIGQRITQFISPGELAIEADGVGSLVQAPAIKNLSIISTANHYMGIRLAVAPNATVENVLIGGLNGATGYGFQTSMEVNGSSYSYFKNVVSAATQVGFGWINSDHVTRITCCDFAVNGSAGPMSVGNRPWFVDWIAQELLDPNSNYWTAHYDAVGGIGTYDCCDGEGGDRSYFIADPFGTVFSGCHMERFVHYGFYQNSGTAKWIGGDYYSANTAPAFSGAYANLSIDSLQPDSSNGSGAITIGSFTGTSRVSVLNTPPAGGDTAPGLGSGVSWDNYNSNIIVETAVNTVGAGTLTAAGLYGGAIVRGGTQTGAFSDTTDTATNIVAAFTSQTINNITRIPAVGSYFRCTIFNSTTQTQTLLAGTGVTFTGPLSASATIAAGASRTLIVSVSNIGTPAVTILG